MRIAGFILYIMLLFSCNEDPAIMENKKRALQEAANQRIQKVISQLKADCDSALINEAIKMAQLPQKPAKQIKVRR